MGGAASPPAPKSSSGAAPVEDAQVGPEAAAEAPAGKAPLAEDAVAGVSNPELRALLTDHWDWAMRDDPRWATTLGDHRFDDRLEDPSHAAELERRAQRSLLLQRARQLTPDALDRSDRVTLDLLREQLSAEVARHVCDAHLWSISAHGNPVNWINYLPKQHRVQTREDGHNLVARYRAIAGWVDAHIENLRRGAAEGLTASAESLRRMLALIDEVLAQDVADWALMEPVGSWPSTWSEPQRRELDEAIASIVRQQVKPAFTRLRATLAEEIVPIARRLDSEGLSGLPRGQQCYAASILAHTGLDETPEVLHALGKSEMARINAEMVELGQRLKTGEKLAATLRSLRTDPSMYFQTGEQILAKARQTLAAAKAAIPAYFGLLPATDCVVAEVPAYEAPFSTIAYYRRPHFDGSKPGEFFVNTFEPTTRPRFEAQALAFHESIPGHHLQLAIAQERGELPAFRKFGGVTAFVEGWGLYAERLSDEMGLYTGDADRMGMLSYDAWRAARLVVDTGIHAFGWSRAQAEEYMRDHTALAANNIENEVDRYIAWPGQALAYKVGQLEILRLRARARERLGPAFDIRVFHDRVLESGALPPPVLARHIEAWLDEATSGKKASLD